MKVSQPTLNYARTMHQRIVNNPMQQTMPGMRLFAHNCKHDRIYQDDVCLFPGEENALFIPVTINNNIRKANEPILFLRIFNDTNTIVSRKPNALMADVGAAHLTN